MPDDPSTDTSFDPEFELLVIHGRESVRQYKESRTKGFDIAFVLLRHLEECSDALDVTLEELIAWYREKERNPDVADPPEHHYV